MYSVEMIGLHKTSEISCPIRGLSFKASHEKCIPHSKVFIAATFVKMFAFLYVFSLQKEPEQVIATEPPPTCQDPQTKDNQPSPW